MQEARTRSAAAASPHRLQPFTDASIGTKAVPLRRNGEMHELRIGTCDRTLEARSSGFCDSSYGLLPL